MAHQHPVVEHELRVHAAEAVLLGGEWKIMPGAHGLQLHPGLPCGGERASDAGILEFERVFLHFVPGLGRLVWVQARFLKGVLIVEEHRGGAVEWQRHHASAGVAVVAGDRRQVGLRVELLLRLRHHLVHRLDRFSGRDHGGRADLEHLHDVRCLAGAVGCDRGGHRRRIVALVYRHHLVVRLRGVKSIDDGVDLIGYGAGIRVPKLDVGGGLGAARAERACGCECKTKLLDLHLNSFPGKHEETRGTVDYRNISLCQYYRKPNPGMVAAAPLLGSSALDGHKPGTILHEYRAMLASARPPGLRYIIICRPSASICCACSRMQNCVRGVSWRASWAPRPLPFDWRCANWKAWG